MTRHGACRPSPPPSAASGASSVLDGSATRSLALSGTGRSPPGRRLERPKEVFDATLAAAAWARAACSCPRCRGGLYAQDCRAQLAERQLRRGGDKEAVAAAMEAEEASRRQQRMVSSMPQCWRESVARGPKGLVFIPKDEDRLLMQAASPGLTRVPAPGGSTVSLAVLAGAGTSTEKHAAARPRQRICGLHRQRMNAPRRPVASASRACAEWKCTVLPHQPAPPCSLICLVVPYRTERSRPHECRPTNSTRARAVCAVHGHSRTSLESEPGRAAGGAALNAPPVRCAPRASPRG